MIFVDSDAKKESFDHLVQAHNKSEQLWQFYFKLMLGVLIMLSITSGASVIHCWIINGRFDENSVFRPLKASYVEKDNLNTNFLKHSYILQFFSVPWNQSTLFGFFEDVLFCIIVAEAVFLFNGAFILLFISICWHHQAFDQMLQHSLIKFEHFNKKRDVKELICNFVNFHNAAKE